ncbi:cytochrome P450 86B1-like [Nymphaea colorata]|uniref:Cytochrome P450 n=1 Tax=Nymphaea colorata TaxID=210225 RepID=A0A5K1ATH4_9MAGN|nr:cytochrome P450 86B1-like [Nymphaea colorata]
MELQSSILSKLVGVVEKVPWPEACVSLLLFFLLHWYHKQRKNPVMSWPLLRTFPPFVANLHRLHEWLTEVLAAAGGTINVSGPVMTNRNFLMTCDPRNLEYILKTNFNNFPKGAEINSAFSELLGSGIFNLDGKPWMTQRKIANAHFHSKLFRQFVVKTTGDIINEQLIPILASSARSGCAIDLHDVLLRFTFDSTCTAVLGENLHSLSSGFPTVPFSKAVDDVLEAIAYRYLLPRSWQHVLRRLNLWKEKQLADAMVVIEEFIACQVNLRKLRRLQTNDLLSIYAGTSEDKTFLRDAAINFLLAGRDTSGNAMGWFFWLLSKYPRVEKRILEEVREILMSNHRENLVLDDLDKLVYLHAALCEALRLHPIVPFGLKGVVKEATLPSGHIVKPGTIIMYHAYSVGRMRWIWGEDCMEFKPERWIDDEGRLRHENNSFRFIAFNAGPRTCVGREVAFVQMKLAAAAILLNFELSVEKDHPVLPRTSVILTMKNGLKVRVKERPQTLL